jgi:hypothetical protein
MLPLVAAWRNSALAGRLMPFRGQPERMLIVEQRDQQGQQQRQNSSGQAAYGNSGEQSGNQGLGQSPAGDAERDPPDETASAGEGAHSSTSAQRSGGQTEGGQGMGNESFEGSSLGGQSSADRSPGAMFGSARADDGSENFIDPTTGQPIDEGFGGDGEGTADASMSSRPDHPDKARPSDLDGE